MTADPRALHAALAAVERELPNGTAHAPAQPVQPPAPPTHPAPEDGAPLSATTTPMPSNVIELPRVAAAVRDPATSKPLPVLELIELPELGFGDDGDGPAVRAEPEVAETIEMVDIPAIEPLAAPILKLVDDLAAPDAILELAPVAAPEVPLQAGGNHAAAPALAEAESDEVTIGDVTLSRSLWTILCDEADQHVATLENELSILQFDPRAVPRAGMVRASHTLCGIHRTGGFPVVATTAKALEQTLIALEQHGAPLPGTAQPVLARATAGLALLVSRIKRQAPFTHGDVDEAGEIQRELDELRQEAATEAGDAEAAAALVAQLEEEAVNVTPEPASAPSPSRPA